MTDFREIRDETGKTEPLLDTQYDNVVWEDPPLGSTDVRAEYFGFERVFRQWLAHQSFLEIIYGK